MSADQEIARSAKIAKAAEIGRQTLPLINTDDTDLNGE